MKSPGRRYVYCAGMLTTLAFDEAAAGCCRRTIAARLAVIDGHIEIFGSSEV